VNVFYHSLLEVANAARCFWRHLSENGDKPSTWICEGCGVTVLRQRFAIFGGIALVQPAQRRRGNTVAQLVNVHSVLRLNYETLKGLISLASPSVAKLTLYETPGRSRRPGCEWVRLK
jgi:hypothetical protein